MELLQLVDVHVEEASRPLREEVAALKLLLAHAGESLELTGGMGLYPMQASLLLDSTEQKSSMVEESVVEGEHGEHLYSCISPRGSPYQSPQLHVAVAYEGEGMDGILDPVLHITPEFHELSKASLEVLPLELGSSEALATLPPQSRTTLVSGAIVEHSSDALFAKELCGLLASLEAVSPGYGKDIDCVLAGQASEDLIMKVENSLKKVIIRGKRRKRGVGRKALAAA
jgi:hypothetical protein